MSKSIRNRLFVVFGVILAALFFTFPVEKHINLGLDLEGGMHLILEVDTEELSANEKKDVVERAIEILRNRIDKIGASEPVIQRQGQNQILVQLPGITNRDAAMKMIGTVAQLEFRLVNSDPNDLEAALKGNVPEGYSLEYIPNNDNEPVLLENKIALSGETVADALVDFDSQAFGQPYIKLKLNGLGTKIFAKVTKENVGERLAIVMDDTVISAPNIRDAITGGDAQITGQFSYDEASNLALALRSGALPAPMHIEEERTIGPLLGKDSIDAGINATIIGGILVFAFMFIYYLQAGIISNIALAINLLLIFGIMGFLNTMLPESQLTLTLPGIAGIILTLGMAVDANVLINERIREEIKNGRPLQASVNNGFNKALKAIIDSNSTTLIAAFMLFQFGSGPIKGFAVTLSIGLVSSLFTALFVTRTIFNALIDIRVLKGKLPMLSFFSDTNINFVSKRFFCFAISFILIIASIVTYIKKKDEAYGIDFAGGQIQEYRFKESIPTEDLRATLKEINLNDAVIQQFDQHPENVIIRTSEDTYTQVSEAFKKNFSYNPFEVMRIEKVGPVVGKALRKSAILAIIFALGGILIYIGFRFKHFDFGAAGVIALLHDVIVTLGIILLMGRQIDLLVVTALLTIAGYSINDTIIIYNRVRENMAKRHKSSLAEIINLSINQTIGRTILTTITTLLVVITLFLRGGEVLNTFALCLIIGFIAGTYSTIFIASPLVLAWESKGDKKKK
ncbi:MAG: protein translocase subunit SecD [Candidatus Omnitrophica bacterium]|nr:protein translocase subunit SecD [Candidatus Omnitrophota bacterium]